ncbi:hypothetical protein [Oleiharenicola lentus]|uniref:hypothetical protein n=1 Tax=Oleiharenicola lentus TaxID=2508720 RepID=UPI003F66C6E3
MAPEKDEPSRSIGIGIACTVVFHVLLFWLSPKFNLSEFSGSHAGIQVNNKNKEKTFDFQLVPPDAVEEKKNPMRFVETNSAAPENTPDKTDNFSNRDQQVAQEVAAKELDPNGLPTVKGQDEIKNDSAIVSGQMAPPQLGTPPAEQSVEQSEQQQNEQKARAEQTPLSGFEKNEGLSEDGIASNISNSKNQSNRADRALEGARDSKETEGGLVSVNESRRPQPKERPRLPSTSLNRDTILTNKVSGSSNIGVSASNAFKSEYGEYLQELIEIVQVQWDNIVRASSTYPQRGTKVEIKFKINSLGEVQVLSIEQTAGLQGSSWSQAAIETRQPYRKWPEKMIDLLGTSQELVFSFYYQ